VNKIQERSYTHTAFELFVNFLDKAYHIKIMAENLRLEVV